MTKKSGLSSGIVLFALIFVLSACKGDLNPDQVADLFWTAAVNNNTPLMKRMCSSNSFDDATDFTRLHTVTAFTLGRIVIDGNSAEVETSLSMKEASRPVSVTTYLTKENGKWRVDFGKTASFLTLNEQMTELIGDIEDLAEEFADEIEGSGEEIKEKALPAIKSQVQQLEKELQKKLPEIRQQIDEFLEELEQSIEESIPDKPPETPETTRT